MQKELQLIGLGKIEAAVYESLVQHGPCRAGVLIAKLDIHRNLVYQALDKLVLKGLATKVSEKGVWSFQITDPSALLSNFRMQERSLSSIVQKIAVARSKGDQQIVVYEGVESYRNYWISSLERIPSGTTDYIIGGSVEASRWKDLMGSWYAQYDALRKQKKIVWKSIQFAMGDAEWQELRENPRLTEYRILPRTFEHIGNVNVIHDTIILHTWGDSPRIIEIRDPSLVQMFMGLFNVLWEMSEPVVS